MLKIESIVKYYKNVKGVENLSLNLSAGSTIGIIGINGSGKTTLFRVLLGLLNADSGTVTFKNKPLSAYPNKLLGYLPEERSLYKDLKVIDQVMLLGRLKNMSDTEIEERLDYYLNFLKISKYKFNQISKLSKGNQQKVQIICALIHDPQVIILDEPLSGLDVVNVSLLKELIYKLKKENKYILMSSHQFEHIEEFCDGLIILKSGDVMFEGSVEDLINLSTSMYITLSKEVGKLYELDERIISLKTDNRNITFELSNKDDATALFKEIIDKENIENISISRPSIETIVKEYELV